MACRSGSLEDPPPVVQTPWGLLPLGARVGLCEQCNMAEVRCAVHKVWL